MAKASVINNLIFVFFEVVPDDLYHVRDEGGRARGRRRAAGEREAGGGCLSHRLPRLVPSPLPRSLHPRHRLPLTFQIPHRPPLRVPLRHLSVFALHLCPCFLVLLFPFLFVFAFFCLV